MPKAKRANRRPSPTNLAPATAPRPAAQARALHLFAYHTNADDKAAVLAAISPTDRRLLARDLAEYADQHDARERDEFPETWGDERYAEAKLLAAGAAMLAFVELDADEQARRIRSAAMLRGDLPSVAGDAVTLAKIARWGIESMAEGYQRATGRNLAPEREGGAR